jgi:hypothetical protein
LAFCTKRKILLSRIKDDYNFEKKESCTEQCINAHVRYARTRRGCRDVEHKQLIISKLPVTLSIDTSLETSQTPLLFASSINTLKSNNDVKKRAIIRSLFPVVTDAQLFAANL